MLLCAKVDMQDFYVIHHEMGHIQYYMAYQDQPAIFQVSISRLIKTVCGRKNNCRTKWDDFIFAAVLSFGDFIINIINTDVFLCVILTIFNIYKNQS